MVRDRAIRFAWGSMLLASLYKDLHEYVYMDGRALGPSVTLLHIWAWEHIVVLWLQIVSVLMGVDHPLMWRYKGGESFTHIGEHGIPY